MVAAPKAARQSKVETNAKREDLYRQIFAKRKVPQRLRIAERLTIKK
jgi:hypothetical protein